MKVQEFQKFESRAKNLSPLSVHLIRRKDVALWLTEFFGKHYYGENYGIVRMW